MTFSIPSRHGVPIRLTDERWLHIVEEHSELAGMLETVLDTVESAYAVFEGSAGERFAARSVEGNKMMVVVYKETSPTDGFIITAFLTRRVSYLERRRRLWP
jgi:hypothetical protein